MPDTINDIEKEIQTFKENHPETMGIIIINDEGMPIVSILGEDEDETGYAGATAEFLTSISRIAGYIGEKEAEFMMIKFNSTYFIVHHLSSGLVLGARFSSATKLGIAFTLTQMLTKNLNKIIG
ncbi:MAG: roadblock/LC7 domain-containing protein [bacterium]